MDERGAVLQDGAWFWYPCSAMAKVSQLCRLGQIMLLGGRVAGYMSKPVWTVWGMGKIQLSFWFTSWIDEDTDAMAYPSPKPSLSKLKKGRAKDWISSWPRGEDDGGQG